MKSIEIKTKNGVCDASLVFPMGSDPLKKYPAVLVLMDAWGPRTNLFQMIQKLSAQGFIVLLPNLFYQQKRPPFVTGINFPVKVEDLQAARAQFVPLMQNFNLQSGLEDVGVFLEFLASQKNCNGKIGVVGYCMGGTLAVRTAAKFPGLMQATAAFHAGNLATEAADSPHLLLGQIQSRLYVAHADNDASMSAESIEKFKQALEKTSLQYKAELYSGAAHGFTMADLPAYNEAACNRHWTHMLEIFSELKD